MVQCLPQWDQSDALHVPSSQDEVYEVQVPKSCLHTLKASKTTRVAFQLSKSKCLSISSTWPLYPFVSLRAEQVAFHNLMPFELGEAHIRTDIARFAGLVQSLVPMSVLCSSFVVTKGLTSMTRRKHFEQTGREVQTSRLVCIGVDEE